MSSRRMIYPYTIMAKIRNVPYKWHYKNNWYFHTFPWAVLVTLPIMIKIQQLSYSEGNLKALEEYRKKEREEFETHKLHLL